MFSNSSSNCIHESQDSEGRWWKRLWIAEGPADRIMTWCCYLRFISMFSFKWCFNVFMGTLLQCKYLNITALQLFPWNVILMFLTERQCCTMFQSDVVQCSNPMLFNVPVQCCHQNDISMFAIPHFKYIVAWTLYNVTTETSLKCCFSLRYLNFVTGSSFQSFHGNIIIMLSPKLLSDVVTRVCLKI